MIAPDTNVLVRYIVQFEKSGADFSDYLIGYLNSDEQAEPTWTFDRRAATAPGFCLLA